MPGIDALKGNPKIIFFTDFDGNSTLLSSDNQKLNNAIGTISTRDSASIAPLPCLREC